MLAPDFPLTNPGADGPRFLSDLRGSPVVLFLPSALLGSDPGRQVALFNRVMARFHGPGEPLVSVALDGLWCHLHFNNSDETVPLVAPLPDGEVARAYGVSGKNAVLVIDAEGLIRWKHVSDSHRSIPPTEVLEALEQLAPVLGVRHRSGMMSRRDFIAATLAATVVLTAGARPARAADGPPTPLDPGITSQRVVLRVNGTDLTLDLDPRVTLLDALREYAGLTGTKKGCDHGQCGACTVQVGQRRIVSCLAFASMHQGQQITTIEGLAQGSELHPMQAAFLEYDGFQCGYCTPGQIMSAVALLNEPCGPDDSHVRECMSGNICRCGAYPNIVAAVQKVRRTASSTSP